MIVTRVWLVARHAFLETVNDRVLYVAAAFGLVLFAVSRVAGPLSAGEDVKVVKDLGLAAIELSGAALAILLGAGSVARDSGRCMLPLLAKPIPRWEFLAGQLAGLALTVALNVLLMGLVLLTVLATMDAPQASPAGPIPAADPRLALALILITAELAVLASVAVLFSVFSSSVLTAAIFSAGVFVAGQLSGDLRRSAAVVEGAPWVAIVVSAIGWLLPAFSSFDVKAEVVHGVPISPAFVAMTCGYAAFYGTAVFATAAAVFSRREFP